MTRLGREKAPVVRHDRLGTIRHRDGRRPLTLERLEGHGRSLGAATPLRLMLAGIVDKDATNGARGNGKALPAIDEVCARLFNEPQVGLVHDGRGRERVASRLCPQLAMRLSCRQTRGRSCSMASGAPRLKAANASSISSAR